MKKLLFSVILYSALYFACASASARISSIEKFDNFYALTPEPADSDSAKFQIDSLALGKPLLIYNGDAKKNKIHIQTFSQLINTKIRIIGHPADLVISSFDGISCMRCDFDNVKRVSLVNGSYNGDSIYTTPYGAVLNIGVSVGEIYAPGAQSLEIYTSKLTTSESSLIDLNLKATNHKGEYLVANESGDVEVGTGGLSLYIGQYTVDYNSGRVTKNHNHSIDLLMHGFIRLDIPKVNIKGVYKSAGFSIASSLEVEIDNGTKINTLTEALSSSNSGDGIYVPSEGVSITTVGDITVIDYSDPFSPHRGRPMVINPRVTNSGSIMSDKKVEVVTAGSFTNNGLILSGKASLFARHGVFNNGELEAHHIEVAGGEFNNTKNVNTNELVVETERDIVNAYGGVIRSHSVTFKSLKGIVANGVRRSGQSISSSWGLLELEKDHEKLNQGIYHLVKDKINYRNMPDLSAKVFASRISVSAKAFENINPYSLSRGANDWSSSIKVSSSRSNSVIFQAENNLEIDVENYILNSSAILSLSQSGTFDINANKVFNERYHLDVDTAYYSGFSVTNDSKTQIYASEKGNKSKVVNYSPPGRMIVFGKLRVSDGTKSPRSTQEFNNLFSYVEVFSKAYFNNLKLTSVGLQLSSDTFAATYADTKYCQSTGLCSSEVIETQVEAETLLSFHGGVYGVKEDLPSSADLDLHNVNGLEADKAAAGKKYMAALEYNWGPNEYASVTSFSVSGDILKFWLYTCRKVLIANTDDSFRRSCSKKEHTVDLDKLLTDSNKDKFVGNTGLTITQIEERLDKYISGLKHEDRSRPPYDTWLPYTAFKTAYQITTNDTMVEFAYKVSGYMALHDNLLPNLKRCEERKVKCLRVNEIDSGKVLISKLPE
ncbi:hypothetical protein [Pseudoalteromonas ardens]|uniref:Filamentous haemagglutinin FhaB/tRNA nuclease CdiA-like TPS domain-containing protein n=1 Tax=Pseudoalteromonas rubra TaxID=43658 RepID=A0A0L0EZ55_9GAMM|nr:hypothetical protein [Pseudoalteromonas sp. R96]KNC69093.1 hypothetical protein AC626_00895 [Pseudoalteromonas rubra]MDK1310499.1 hypothetical protein [Pseudoalteromonas sp. R96]